MADRPAPRLKIALALGLLAALAAGLAVWLLSGDERPGDLDSQALEEEIERELPDIEALTR